MYRIYEVGQSLVVNVMITTLGIQPQSSRTPEKRLIMAVRNNSGTLAEPAFIRNTAVSSNDACQNDHNIRNKLTLTTPSP